MQPGAITCAAERMSQRGVGPVPPDFRFGAPVTARFEADKPDHAADCTESTFDSPSRPEDIVGNSACFMQSGADDAARLLADLAALNRATARNPPFSPEDLATLAAALAAGCREPGRGTPSLKTARRVLARLDGMDLAAGFRPSRVRPDWLEKCAWRTVQALGAAPGLLRRLCHWPDPGVLPEAYRQDKPVETFLDIAAELIGRHPGLSPHPASLIDDVNAGRFRGEMPDAWLRALPVARKLIGWEAGLTVMGKRLSDDELVCLRKARHRIDGAFDNELDQVLGKLPSYVERSGKRTSALGKARDFLLKYLMPGSNKKPFEALKFNKRLSDGAGREVIFGELRHAIHTLKKGEKILLSSDGKGAWTLDFIKAAMAKLPLRFVSNPGVVYGKKVAVAIEHAGHELRLSIVKNRNKAVNGGAGLALGYGVEAGHYAKAGIKLSATLGYCHRADAHREIGLRFSSRNRQQIDAFDRLRFENLLFTRLLKARVDDLSLTSRILLDYPEASFLQASGGEVTRGPVAAARAYAGIFVHDRGKNGDVGIGFSGSLVAEHASTDKHRHAGSDREKRMNTHAAVTRVKAQGGVGLDVLGMIRSGANGEQDRALLGKPIMLGRFCAQKTLYEKKVPEAGLAMRRHKGKLVKVTDLRVFTSADEFAAHAQAEIDAPSFRNARGNRRLSDPEFAVERLRRQALIAAIRQDKSRTTITVKRALPVEQVGWLNCLEAGLHEAQERKDKQRVKTCLDAIAAIRNGAKSLPVTKYTAVGAKTRSDALDMPVLKDLVQALPIQGSRVNALSRMSKLSWRVHENPPVPSVPAALQAGYAQAPGERNKDRWRKPDNSGAPRRAYY